ncbi:MAG: hypothetical protein ABIB98_01405 [bacterium]
MFGFLILLLMLCVSILLAKIMEQAILARRGSQVDFSTDDDEYTETYHEALDAYQKADWGRINEGASY